MGRRRFCRRKESGVHDWSTRGGSAGGSGGVETRPRSVPLSLSLSLSLPLPLSLSLFLSRRRCRPDLGPESQNGARRRPGTFPGFFNRYCDESRDVTGV